MFYKPKALAATFTHLQAYCSRRWATNWSALKITCRSWEVFYDIFFFFYRWINYWDHSQVYRRSLQESVNQKTKDSLFFPWHRWQVLAGESSLWKYVISTVTRAKENNLLVSCLHFLGQRESNDWCPAIVLFGRCALLMWFLLFKDVASLFQALMRSCSLCLSSPSQILTLHHHIKVTNWNWSMVVKKKDSDSR